MLKSMSSQWYKIKNVISHLGRMTGDLCIILKIDKGQEKFYPCFSIQFCFQFQDKNDLNYCLGTLQRLTPFTWCLFKSLPFLPAPSTIFTYIPPAKAIFKSKDIIYKCALKAYQSLIKDHYHCKWEPRMLLAVIVKWRKGKHWERGQLLPVLSTKCLGSTKLELECIQGRKKKLEYKRREAVKDKRSFLYRQLLKMPQKVRTQIELNRLVFHIWTFFWFCKTQFMKIDTQYVDVTNEQLKNSLFNTINKFKNTYYLLCKHLSRKEQEAQRKAEEVKWQGRD